MRRSAVIFLLLISTWVQGAPADFARGMTIVPRGPAPAQRLVLPVDVYQWVTRNDLGDLRVYDAEGNALPYALRQAPAGESRSAWQQLPLFPLPKPADHAGPGAAVDIELGEGGAVVAVRGPVATRPGETGFLIDASRYPAQPAELKLDWSSDRGDFVARVTLEASDDLSNWRTLVAATTVAALTAEGQRIRLDQLEVPPAGERYLRLRQLDAEAPLMLESVAVRARTAVDPQRDWVTLYGTRGSDGFEFHTDARIPADRLDLQLAEETYLTEARLFARADPDEPWQDLGAHRFYRARVNDHIARSQPVTERNPNHRYWRLQLSGDEAFEPRLRVGWVPHQVVFLRHGKPPYLLAYGQAELEGRQWPMTQLLDQLDLTEAAPERAGPAQEVAAEALDRLPLAELKEPHTLRGEAALQPGPKPIQWRTLALWLVLLVGVALVAALAYRLIRSGERA